ncbi:zinc-type alcohol dehydrogenase-like protein SACOL2177 [Aspergillus lentulus]|uniref:Zinc-type alcohol dehydrogenase-like protein SACOL2177 n=1 Tax=Aspergillus lentulus TaxID=293939 RepID=A0ABQ0ZSS3_ASPLE|nr:zinc-type alcohol dehydrogenase-like protein SACOL2177 [Aspergillus lentulus]GFF46270.1 zinc-type alcohol dehydrogenase-like protein SACOL2177 [Aspergillus lentulus]GFF63209.1 zinc-type alcohol dehydrogenase-like protein SACOL2177 [Aspergillus lentulus]GFF68649.1 zinc-type alcohol dehydrogenase-like protein SACOL2177 [Aspergillus lentulus]GFF77589.1 zinc-type alcohol dehydrogenase-like protein SACOL2177 [Aspergillus lentulus]GFG14504.1 zinc-type alcohol dehydrogenase-like protein SACOL2177 
MTNEAAWLKEPKANVEIAPAPMYTPGPGDVLVKVESIGFNSIDAKIQKHSALPIPYPAILGVSFAGVVEEVGPAVTSVQLGDRVVVSKCPGGGNSYSAFQKYALARESFLAKLDRSTTFDDASAAITNLATIVAALTIQMGLQRPPLSGKAEPNGKRVLIYGGSSSCGRYATKYASDAGYEVVTTSSPGHRKTVEEHNPSYIIDHTLPHEKLISELKSHGPYDAVFDAIGTPPVTAMLVAMFGEKGGSYHTTLPPMGDELIPTNVERTFASYTALLNKNENEDVRKWFFEQYVPKGLANGQIIPSSIIKKENGLRSVQEVLDSILSITGKRFVVNPQN